MMLLLILMMMMMWMMRMMKIASARVPGECACAVPQAPLRIWSAVACGGVLGLRSEYGRSLMWECERRGDLTTGRAAAFAVVP
jgi:hypothetical protein